MLVVGIFLAQLVSTDLRPNRSDLAERVKRMDAAWVSHRDFDRRQAAVVEISGAVMAFFSGQTGDACRALDRAMSALEKKAPAGLDALIVRSEPRVAKPGEDVKLTFGWAYSASDTPIKVLGKTYMVEPSKNLVVSVHAAKTEGVQRISFESGKERRVASINVINDFDARVAKLKTSPTSSAIADALQQVAAGTYETEIPAADWLARGERIQKLSWKAVEEIPAVDDVGTRFRVQIPAGAPTDAPVVIALHGAGGSENMFFESYGAGAAPKEAKKRGWGVHESPFEHRGGSSLPSLASRSAQNESAQSLRDGSQHGWRTCLEQGDTWRKARCTCFVCTCHCWEPAHRNRRYASLPRGRQAGNGNVAHVCRAFGDPVGETSQKYLQTVRPLRAPHDRC